MRCRTAAEVARAIKTMVIRGAPAIGVAAAMGIALGMRKSQATGTQKFAAEFYKICELMAATRPTAVNLFWAIERMKRAFAAAAAGGRVGRRDQGPARPRGAAPFTTRTSRAAARWARFGAERGAGRGAHPHALQRRRAGDGRLRHGARRHPRRRRAGQAGHRVRRRDAAVPAGRAAHRLGARARRHPDDGHHRQHGRRADAAGAASTWSSSAPIASPPTATRRTRSAPTPSPCSRASTASRSTSPRRSRRSTSARRTARQIPIEERNAREVTHVGGYAARAGRRARPEPGVRRHAARARSPASSPSAASSARRTSSR